jgi:hypothetical protein
MRMPMTADSNRTAVRAGRILLGLAALHLTITGATAAHHVPDWTTGGLWPPPGGLGDPDPINGAFWMTWGNFAVPLGLVGALAVWLGRNGHTPPRFLAYTIVGWALVGAAFFEPSPFILGAIPGLMLAGAASPRRTDLPVASPTPR